MFPFWSSSVKSGALSPGSSGMGRHYASGDQVRGRWPIVEMELWDLDVIDLLGPGFIELREDDQGSFRFIAVECWMDTRSVDREGRAGIEFSWEGNDEMDPASGRGWAMLEPDGALEGRIYGAASSRTLTAWSNLWTSVVACRPS